MVHSEKNTFTFEKREDEISVVSLKLRNSFSEKDVEGAVLDISDVPSYRRPAAEGSAPPGGGIIRTCLPGGNCEPRGNFPG